MLAVKDYAFIQASVPILCADLLIKADADRFLLLKRANPPRVNTWWVPGGRVRYGETLPLAAKRIAWEETGLTIAFLGVNGVYTELSERGHAVALVCTAVALTLRPVILDAQSLDWRWGEQRDLPNDLRYFENCAIAQDRTFDLREFAQP